MSIIYFESVFVKDIRPVSSSTIYWKDYLYFFVKDGLTLFMWVCFWVLCFVPLTVCSFVVLHYLDYCSCVVSTPPTFLLLQYCVGYSGSFVSLYNFLEFWLRLHWICGSSWEEQISWPCWVFQSMNVGLLSICFFLDFVHQGFLHIGIIYILLDFYLSYFILGVLM